MSDPYVWPQTTTTLGEPQQQWVQTYVTEFEMRAKALELAVDSHGEESSPTADQHITTRAAHFLSFLKGDNDE